MHKNLNKRQLNQLGFKVIEAAIKVHTALGPGLLESVYEKCLIHELKKRGFDVKSQLSIPIIYDGIELDAQLRLDILVDDLLIVEVKAVTEVHPVHSAQILSYMKLLKVPKGIILNFHCEKITDAAEHFGNELFWDLPA